VATKAARFRFPTMGASLTSLAPSKPPERLLAHPIFTAVKCIKVNPDRPQRYVREAALERGLTVLVPTPRLKGGFWKLDPTYIPPDKYAEAATLKKGGCWGRQVPLEAMPRVDLIVTGSVAVTRDGRRCGKDHGYGDLEYAILKELGYPPVPVVTTVHPLQLVEGFPAESRSSGIADRHTRGNLGSERPTARAGRHRLAAPAARSIGGNAGPASVARSPGAAAEVTSSVGMAGFWIRPAVIVAEHKIVTGPAWNSGNRSDLGVRGKNSRCRNLDSPGRAPARTKPGLGRIRVLPPSGRRRPCQSKIRLLPQFTLQLRVRDMVQRTNDIGEKLC
jgi:5-formyltetrahydrofolate cyclo-ligase